MGSTREGERGDVVQPPAPAPSVERSLQATPASNVLACCLSLPVHKMTRITWSPYVAF